MLGEFVGVGIQRASLDGDAEHANGKADFRRNWM